MRVMLDTNILVSMIFFPSIITRTFARSLSENHRIVLCDYVIEELRLVTERKFPNKMKKMSRVIKNYRDDVELRASFNKLAEESLGLDFEDWYQNCAFGVPIKKVTLGFTPRDTADWQCREHKEEDCTLFIKGEGLRDFPKEKLMFALLGHA